MIKQTEMIHENLAALGINPGDAILMHSSYKSLGEVKGGPKAFFDALLSYLGKDGTLVMPALSFVSVTRNNPVFDLKTTPSCVGFMPEFFRTQIDGVKRSMHATHSCCAIGKYADELVRDHELDATPVGENSPFTKLPRVGGKILFLGCSTNRNTSMHGVEEVVEPPYLLDRENTVTYQLNDGEGNVLTRESCRHNFVINGVHYAQHYSRIVPLLDENEIKRGNILAAESTVMSAPAVWQKGVEILRADPYYFVKD